MSKRDRPLVVLVVVAVAAFAVWLHLRQTPEEQPAKPGPAVGVAAEEEPARLAETGSLWQFAAEAPKAAARKRSASLSLTASDGTRLKLASLDARGIVQGPLAFTEIRLVFENPQSRTLEGTFRITLPQGAAISRFAMRQGDRWQEGEVVEKQAADAPTRTSCIDVRIQRCSSRRQATSSPRASSPSRPRATRSSSFRTRKS